MAILTPMSEPGIPAGAGPDLASGPAAGSAPDPGDVGAPPAWLDPAVIGRIANAFFQAAPSQEPAAPHVLTLPSSPPSPGDVPSVSPAATLAPHAPARPPTAGPDLPPVTVPSVVPTPNIPAPHAPTAVAVPGVPGLPQPGGSPGLALPDFPGAFSFGALPPGIASALALDTRRPPAGTEAPALPAGALPDDPGSLYFLRELGPADPLHRPEAAGRATAETPALPQAAPVAPPAAEPRAAPGLDLSGVSAGLSPALVPDLALPARPFDPHAVKRDFPILQQSVHGKPLIWLDNAATTQKPQAVIDRLSRFYEHENSNIHRAAHALAARATDAYEAAREKVRRFLNAGSVKEIIFVRGATEAINLVAQTYGRRHVKEGDEIVVTHLEHHANIVPWQQLAAEKGARLKVVPVDDTGQVILEEYEKLLGPRTRIVALAQVSNALGTVVPVREMTAIAHRHGACVLVDGAQSVSHMKVDVQALDADFFVFSGHKVFGPTGIGVVYGKADVLAHLPPWQGGGNMIADVTFEKTIYNGPPERFEAGTGNIADAVGLGAAIDYVEAIGMEVIARYEHELLVYATERLLTVPGLKLIGTARDKASVLSFVLDECRTQDVGAALDREGIAVRAGHHCAQPILRRFGLESTVRPSLAFYNTREDVDALETALKRIQASRAHRG